MKLFNIKIPPGLIAQFPPKKRGDSRLLILDLPNRRIIDEQFINIVKYITDRDCLIYNDARVIHARLYGKKMNTGARIELLLTRKLDETCWLALVRPLKRVRAGTEISLAGGLIVKIVERCEEGLCRISFSRPVSYDDLNGIGEIPLPKYIKRKPLRDIDDDRYQTVYSEKYGAVASPTAGLHFTPEIIRDIEKRGAVFVPVTLYVDWGTFKPVREKDYREHRIHSEIYEISDKSAGIINSCIRNGRRIICIGTTSVRAVESAVGKDGMVVSGRRETSLYIYPGYKFRVVDALVTNFHMPDSTLILLVAAFAGEDEIVRAYNHAVSLEYRFFSYGDAMFIIRR